MIGPSRSWARPIDRAPSGDEASRHQQNPATSVPPGEGPKQGLRGRWAPFGGNDCQRRKSLLSERHLRERAAQKNALRERRALRWELPAPLTTTTLPASRDAATILPRSEADLELQLQRAKSVRLGLARPDRIALALADFERPQHVRGNLVHQPISPLDRRTGPFDGLAADRRCLFVLEPLREQNLGAIMPVVPITHAAAGTNALELVGARQADVVGVLDRPDAPF